jgi:Protein of unknown function (DUF2281)
MNNLPIFTQFQQLPHNLQREVADFIHYLSTKNVETADHTHSLAKRIFLPDDFSNPPTDSFSEYLECSNMYY